MKPIPLAPRLVWTTIFSLLPLACTGEADPPRPPRVVLVSIDTLRQDRLGIYGGPAGISPHTDAFADGAVVFDRAFSSSSWTLPSHVTMLSGLHPSTHGVRAQELKPANAVPMLAEILRDRGYTTFAITGGGFVDTEAFARGFDSFEVNPSHEATAADLHAEDFRSVVRHALARIAALEDDRPYFAFLHTYAVHRPYRAPAPFFGSMGPVDEDLVGLETEGWRGERKATQPTDRERSYLETRYAEGVRWVDEALGELYAFLATDERLDDTIVIVTSDHGEAFFEHGRLGHGEGLYREVLAIPLIVRSPRLPARRVGSPVGLVDLAPTVLELAGVEVPAYMEGTSLVPLMTGEETAGDRVALSEEIVQNRDLGTAWSLESVIDDRHHLILRRRVLPADKPTSQALLFDLEADVEEAHNLAREHRPTVRRLGRELKDRLERSPVRFTAEERSPLSDEQRRRLEALGYLGD